MDVGVLATEAETVEGMASRLADFLAGLLASGVLPNLGDDALLMLAGSVEALGRLADTSRVALAAEVVERSTRPPRDAWLSARKGHPGGVELLARVTRQSEATLRARVRLGSKIRPSYSLIGEAFPAAFPAVAREMVTGRLGVDSADVIVRALTGVCAAEEDVRGAEEALVASACGDSFDGLPAQVPFTVYETQNQERTWRSHLDPDGVLSDEEKAMKQRGITRGREQDGVVRYHLSLMPEIAATFESIMTAFQSPRTRNIFLSDEERAVAEASKDPRTWDQQRHDVFASLIDAASRDKDLPQIGGMPPAVTVSVREQDLLRKTGSAFAEGFDWPISVHAAAQKACNGGVQKVLMGRNGMILELSSPERCFTPNQRKVIALRDGGCTIPGCKSPMRWVEIHHVEPHGQGGPTTVANGIALCWFHHRTIETSGWQITMIKGSPHTRMPEWMAGYGNPNPWRPTSKSPTRALDQLDTT